MHTKITGWRASRSGPRMTITGYVEGSKLVKIGALSIQGPSALRVDLPNATIGIQMDGSIIELA